MNKKIYLDYAATTPVHPSVVEAVSNAMENNFGNASSQHSFGRSALNGIDKARGSIAEFLHTKPSNIIFTSGATESNNLVVLNCLKRYQEPKHIIISSIEHPSLIEPVRELQTKGWIVDFIPVDKNALIDVEKFKSMLRSDTCFVGVMYVNNEIGTIEPVEDVSQIIREFENENNTNIFFHIDAVQAAPYLDIDVNKIDCDSLTISAHKIYGPKGIGVLYLKDRREFDALFFGGGQEYGLRSGTLNTPGIIGFAEAVKFIQSDEYQVCISNYLVLRDMLWQAIKDAYPQARWHGDIKHITPSHLFFSLPKISNETLLILLDRVGIAVSAGSACSAGAIKKSHVASACGIDYVDSVIRLSIGLFTTEEDVRYFDTQFRNAINHLRS